MMINYPRNIEESGLDIYHEIDPTDPNLYIPLEDLETILADALIGLSLEGYPVKTRSRIIKEKICEALGYPIPKSFKRTRPKFVGQNFDVYSQQRRNVQIYNDDVNSGRRYVFIRVDNSFIVKAVKVVSGNELALYDRTGTITTKYQARMNSLGRNICSKHDTQAVSNWLTHEYKSLWNVNPNALPAKSQLLGIEELYSRLLPLVGQSIDYLNAVQERNRGAELHAMICKHLGYSIYEDNGDYPDITNQLLEVKLQTSPTIDLGLHSPEDGEVIIQVNDMTFYSEDVRYAIFDGEVCGNRIILRNLYIVTGEDFTNYFPMFKGRGINSKIQIPLPNNFFD